jgi:dCMP deaminase
MKEKFKNYYMKIAELTAELSYAKRLKVGAIIVKDNRVISIGYNGTPAGFDNCCEDSDGNTKGSCIHSEENAIMKICQSHESSKGAVMFITHQPCINCSRLIYNSGISKVYYKNTYRLHDGLEFLDSVGVDVERIGEKI